jgi:Mycothiol maleylpyruvate isomerase N-terminal domain
MTQQIVETETALVDAAGRTAQLLRRGLDPTARVPGLSWSVAETAAHLVADLREHAALAAGAHHPSAATRAAGNGQNAAERGAAANQAQLDAFSERDLPVLADLLEDAAVGLNAAIAPRPSEKPIVTANGVEMTPPTLVSISLGEQLIHGLDLARAARRPWPIDRSDALRVIPGILAVAPHYLDQRTASGLHLDYELRFGPRDRYRFAIDSPEVTVSPANSSDDHPDCVITADPVAFLLVGYGRIGQWSQILRGKLRAGGRRPWLALRFSSLLIHP